MVWGEEEGQQPQLLSHLSPTSWRHQPQQWQAPPPPAAEDKVQGTPPSAAHMLLEVSSTSGPP